MMRRRGWVQAWGWRGGAAARDGAGGRLSPGYRTTPAATQASFDSGSFPMGRVT